MVISSRLYITFLKVISFISILLMIRYQTVLHLRDILREDLIVQNKNG